MHDLDRGTIGAAPERRAKWFRMFDIALVAVAFFIASGFLMAHEGGHALFAIVYGIVLHVRLSGGA